MAKMGRLCMLALLVTCGACKEQHLAPAAASVPAGHAQFDHHILVDQFGYLPNEAKVAVIRDPQIGFDRADRFTPGNRYEVRRASDETPVYAAAPVPWHEGALDETSGDRGWWFDFSALETPGRYFVYDASQQARSAVFAIDPAVYREVLRLAVRTYLYQRSGFRKSAAHAGKCWQDDAAYLGSNQDTEAHDVTDPDNPAKIRDLRGGWFDAGDTNKYVTFAVQAVHQLLTAFETNPAAFGDATGIPESNNGVPDVLDEIRWETDWLARMQFDDGSLALKVGDKTYAAASPPSSDRSPRFYVPACTSATIAGAGMLAHAAYVFRSVPPLDATASDLAHRAQLAWRQYQATPRKQVDCDSGAVHAGIADLSQEDQSGLAVEASIYLYALTSDKDYENYLREHYRQTYAYHDFGWSRYKPDQGEALLFYTTLPHADERLQRIIASDKLADVRAGSKVYGFSPDDDLYRAYLHPPQYHWGSNNPRANYGNSNLDVTNHALGLSDTSTFRTRALEILHYFHGVNPLGIVYLSNMHAAGATTSANEIYHTWFAAGTKWSDARTSECGPPPGYVPGGPNAVAAKDGVPASLAPPNGQPPQKSYRDWNVGSPDSSWAVTEPGIYYEAAYVRLLSAFAN